jgi:RNase H-fold protein (predicted Holliday junction resolvase)
VFENILRQQSYKKVQIMDLFSREWQMIEIAVAFIVTMGGTAASITAAYFAFRSATHSKSTSHSVNDREKGRKADKTLRDLVIENHDGIVELNGRLEKVETKVGAIYAECPMTQDDYKKE